MQKKGPLDIFHFLPLGPMTQPVIFLNRLCSCALWAAGTRGGSQSVAASLTFVLRLKHGKAVDRLLDFARVFRHPSLIMSLACLAFH